MTLDDCADYIITKTCDDGSPPSVLKLQKLVYYAQAWHLAFYGRPLFAGKFEAWVHGPCSRALYRRFAGQKLMYGTVTVSDVRGDFRVESLPPEEVRHIDNVLETYAGLTGTQLEELTHNEDPWLRARNGLPMNVRCETEIDESDMARFYRARLG